MRDTEDEIAATLCDRFGEALRLPEGLGGIEVLRQLAAHRTHRCYRDEPIDPALLRLICACALSAPSKSDLQQADIVEVARPTLRAAIAELIPAMGWIRDAAAFVVVCGNGRRLRQISDFNGETFANDHLDAFFNATVDAGLVLGQLIVAAEAAGLGTCPISVIRNHASQISKLLSLPEHVFPVAGLCLGWPAEEGPISARLPLSLTLHRDEHCDDDWSERIVDYDRRRGLHEGWDPDAADFAGWSLRKARMYAEPQRDDFGAFVRAKGFCLE